MRKLIELGYERALRQAYLGSSVRLGEDQLPNVWRLHARAYRTLDLEPVPDLYLTQFPVGQRLDDRRRAADRGRCSRASSSCSTRTQLYAVLAHEAGHVLSDHALYGDGADDHPAA